MVYSAPFGGRPILSDIRETLRRGRMRRRARKCEPSAQKGIRTKMRTLATVGLMGAAITCTSPALAEDVPDLEVYGTLLPFVENVGTVGATPQGTMVQNDMLPAGLYTGVNHQRRFRMTAGTSHIGFRGEWALDADWLKLVWQVESPTPIDGEGPSNWANRNTHVGFSGKWGTLVYGNWDTPMRWATVTSVNPLKGGYTGDMTAIIGTPGHGVPAWNADQILTATFSIPPNGAGFFRHEANSVQYWSPNVAGFTVRLMYALNEHRTAGTLSEVPVDPYNLSGSIGWDNDWLRLRYSAEYHHDYFGSGAWGNNVGLSMPTSSDMAHLGLVSVTINGKTTHKTRIVATGDYLMYHTDNTAMSAVINDYSRAAIYGLVQQTLGKHNIWAAYGMTTEGSCQFNGTGGSFACGTAGLSAKYYTLGYMYEFSKATQVYLLGYGLVNDTSARYTPFPLLDSRNSQSNGAPPVGEIAPGSDAIGVGLGFVYTFSAKILGKKDEAAAKPAEAAPKPAAEPEAEEAEAEPEPSEPAAEADEAPADEPEPAPADAE
jgi:predicted porin